MIRNLQKIPLAQTPNQKIRVVLDGQNCTIHLYQRGAYLYMDLTVDENAVMYGALCIVSGDLVQYKSQYFTGHLFFIDKTGHKEMPSYEALNDRFVLLYHPGVS